MTHQVVLVHTDEGYSVYAPALPGCASQGETEEEALTNIQDAIREYLEVVREIYGTDAPGIQVAFREVQVA